MLCLIVASLLAASPPPSVSVEDQLFNYFTEHITSTGLVLDRASDKSRVSVAATGFGMYVWAVASQRGQMNQAIASYRIKKSFRTTVEQNPYKNRGFFYHFTLENGTPVDGTEVSTIDTAIFYLGAQRAAFLLNDEDFKKEVQEQIDKVDTVWMMNGKYMRHGLYWDGETPRFINVVWDNYSEGIMIYRLFNITYTPQETKYTLSLFAYYYPLCFFDEPLMVENLRKAITSQQERYSCFGFTALDTEFHGYQDFDPDTISPLVIATLTTYLKLPKLRNQDAPTLSSPADNHVCILSRNRLTHWESYDMIGVETGANFILLWKSKNQ